MRTTRSLACFMAVSLIAYAGSMQAAAQDCSACWSDLNGDGIVNHPDLGQLLADWGEEYTTACQPDEHTVALWYLNGNGTDFSGNGNDLTVRNDRVAWGASGDPCRKWAMMGDDPWEGGCENSDGGALTAPGTGCSYPGSDGWTVEAWVYFPSNSHDYTIVYHYSEHVAGHDPYGLKITNGVARFQIQDGANDTAFVEADVSEQKGKWFHIAGVYRHEQQDLALWVNGDRLALEPTTLVPETLTDHDVFVGGTYCGTTTGVKIDEVRIADRAGSPGWHLYVCNSHSGLLAWLDGVTGGCRGSITGQDLDYPTGLALGPDGDLYLACAGSTDAILRYARQTGQLSIWGTCDGMDDPGGITFGPDGNLYVVAHTPQAVLRFSGQTSECMGPFTSGGSLVNPSDLVFGPDGDLYVTSSEQDNVQRFDGGTGDYIEDFIESGAGGLDHPNGLRFGPDGRLYVCSGFTNQVLRYDGTTGEFVSVFASSGGLDLPGFLEFGPDGNLYVGNIYGANVLRYGGEEGMFLDVFAWDCGFDNPKGLAFVGEL